METGKDNFAEVCRLALCLSLSFSLFLFLSLSQSHSLLPQLLLLSPPLHSSSLPPSSFLTLAPRLFLTMSLHFISFHFLSVLDTLPCSPHSSRSEEHTSD